MERETEQRETEQRETEQRETEQREVQNSETEQSKTSCPDAVQHWPNELRGFQIPPAIQSLLTLGSSSFAVGAMIEKQRGKENRSSSDTPQLCGNKLWEARDETPKSEDYNTKWIPTEGLLSAAPEFLDPSMRQGFS